MNLSTSAMIIEGGYLLKIGVEIRDGNKTYSYTLFPDGIDLISMSDGSQQPSGIASLFGGPPPPPKDQIMPYSHIIPLMDLWELKTEQLRTLRELEPQ